MYEVVEDIGQFPNAHAKADAKQGPERPGIATEVVSKAIFLPLSTEKKDLNSPSPHFLPHTTVREHREFPGPVFKKVSGESKPVEERDLQTSILATHIMTASGKFEHFINLTFENYYYLEIILF